MTVSDDEILERVAALPRHDAAPAVAERIRRAALAEFRGESQGAPRSDGAARPAGLWTRFVEPALVVASVVAYLTWTAATLSALHVASRTADFGERGATERH
jgi:hypothetical protein